MHSAKTTWEGLSERQKAFAKLIALARKEEPHTSSDRQEIETIISGLQPGSLKNMLTTEFHLGSKERRTDYVTNLGCLAVKNQHHDMLEIFIQALYAQHCTKPALYICVPLQPSGFTACDVALINDDAYSLLLLAECGFDLLSAHKYPGTRIMAESMLHKAIKRCTDPVVFYTFAEAILEASEASDKKNPDLPPRPIDLTAEKEWARDNKNDEALRMLENPAAYIEKMKTRYGNNVIALLTFFAAKASPHEPHKKSRTHDEPPALRHTA